jgi:tetratricopeptide (TPR) repeat protein
MKLVQKILSHGLFIAFIVGAFLVYTKRAELFPQWFGASQPVAAKASSGKLADAAPDAGIPATERKVSRPLPEKTLMKKEVEPPAAPERAAPPQSVPGGETPVPGQQTPPAGSTSTSPGPAGAATAQQHTGTDAVTTQPVFRPLDESEQDQAAAEAATAQQDTGNDSATTQPVFRPLDERKQGQAGAQQSEPPVSEKAPGEGTPAQTVFRPSDEEQPVKTGETVASAAPMVEAPASETVAPAQAEAPPSGQPEAANAPPPAADKVAVAAPAEVARAAAPKAAADDTAAAQSTSEAPAGAEDARLQQMLEQARGLFWRRDLRGAAAAYTAVSDDYPDNAEVWGEIGNFYFSLHQAEPAGEAYARAIELLARNDEPMRARRLLDVLFRLDPERARELEARLRAQPGG